MLMFLFPILILLFMTGLVFIIQSLSMAYPAFGAMVFPVFIITTIVYIWFNLKGIKKSNA